MSLRETIITKLTACAQRAMAVAQLTSLHLSIPSSGTTSTPGRLESAPVSPVPLRIPRHTPFTVSFAPDVDVIVSTPARTSRMVGPVSHDLLQSSQEFSLPIYRCDWLNPVPAAITVTLPAYVLFPFADPFDGEDMLSTLRFPPLPAPPGFAPIGQPGSLPVQSVVMNTSPVHNASSSPVPMASADSPPGTARSDCAGGMFACGCVVGRPVKSPVVFTRFGAVGRVLL